MRGVEILVKLNPSQNFYRSSPYWLIIPMVKERIARTSI